MTTAFAKGLSDVGNGIYAYLQPSGTWGRSNSGLITDGTTSVLVDTLQTLEMTQEMLDSVRAAVPSASIEVLINSHADPDHTFGNQLVEGARIIATDRAAKDMAVDLTPDEFRAILADMSDVRDGARFLRKIAAPFDLSGIQLTLPTETFTGGQKLRVGDKTIELIELGPAHSGGDLIVYVPDDRVVFVADLLFVGGHAPVWSGPIANWTRACEFILNLNVDVVVPGHGAITDKSGLREFCDYLHFVETEATRFHERGLSAIEAARAIDLSPYADWIDAERIVLAIDTTYRDIEGKTTPRDRMAMFGQMGLLKEEIG